MRSGKSICLSAAVILGAAGMILGNYSLALGALAADDTRESAIVMLWEAPVSAVQLPDTGMYRNAEGEVYIAQANRNVGVQKEEEAPMLDEAAQSPDVESRKATTVASGSAEGPTKEGTPLDNEATFDKAQEVGIAAIVEKYALTQETLGKFTVTAKYYEVMDEAPDKHIWWVYLYPANNDDFSEIGCYWTYLDAETGDILQLNSAANGKG